MSLGQANKILKEEIAEKVEQLLFSLSLPPLTFLSHFLSLGLILSLSLSLSFLLLFISLSFLSLPSPSSLSLLYYRWCSFSQQMEAIFRLHDQLTHITVEYRSSQSQIKDLKNHIDSLHDSEWACLMYPNLFAKLVSNFNYFNYFYFFILAVLTSTSNKNKNKKK